MPAEVRDGRPRDTEALGRYWKKNVLIMSGLLVIWAMAGLGAGVLFADTLNAFHVGGYPLGFWFAQQGSIIVFVCVILVYAVVMNRMDVRHHLDLEADAASISGPAPEETNP